MPPVAESLRMSEDEESIVEGTREGLKVGIEGLLRATGLGRRRTVTAPGRRRPSLVVGLIHRTSPTAATRGALPVQPSRGAPHRHLAPGGPGRAQSRLWCTRLHEHDCETSMTHGSGNT